MNRVNHQRRVGILIISSLKLPTGTMTSQVRKLNPKQEYIQNRMMIKKKIVQRNITMALKNYDEVKLQKNTKTFSKVYD